VAFKSLFFIMSKIIDGTPQLPKMVASGHLSQFNSIPVYNLDNGQRVFRFTDMTFTLRGKPHGKFANYLATENIKQHLPERLRPEEGAERRPRGVTEAIIDNQIVNTYDAEDFIDVCIAFIEASEGDSVLSEPQREIVERARKFIIATAKIGITGLIDEATGYQYTRPSDELALKLEYFLSEEMRDWEKTFPDELWRQFGRLTNWTNLKKRPKYWGLLVNELIYKLLDKDVASYLQVNHPPKLTGKRYHQWLDENRGVKALTEHIWQVIGIARTVDSIEDLRYQLRKQFSGDYFQPKLFDKQVIIPKDGKENFDRMLKGAAE
jgi:hypothetical protein